MSTPYAEVIGDPISQSKSPVIHNFWLGKLGIDAEYRACHVRPAELPDYFARRRMDAGWRGCNVTIPHKVAAAGLVDGLDPAARRVGAVNTVAVAPRGLTGFNTDIDGIIEAIPSPAHWPEAGGPVPVHLIGAGGAARAALVALQQAGYPQVSLFARDTAKARSLLTGLGLDRSRALPLSALSEIHAPDDRAACLIVNASPLGMTGYPPLGIRLDNYPDDTAVFDMVYAPLETPLLRDARARNMRGIDGLVMLIGQAASAFERFFGDPAPRKHDDELRELLTR